MMSRYDSTLHLSTYFTAENTTVNIKGTESNKLSIFKLDCPLQWLQLSWASSISNIHTVLIKLGIAA